jgi:hypothetical protein
MISGLFFVTIWTLPAAFIVDYLARKRGWEQQRWFAATLLLGPLTIPLIYLVQAISAVSKMVHPPRP